MVNYDGPKSNGVYPSKKRRGPRESQRKRPHVDADRAWGPVAINQRMPNTTRNQKKPGKGKKGFFPRHVEGTCWPYLHIDFIFPASRTMRNLIFLFTPPI